MTYETYKLLHFLGLFLAFTALGGQLFYVLQGGSKADAKARGLMAAFHGIGLVLVLVGGFGMHARLQLDGFPGWFLAKLGLWLVLGAWIAIPWRKPGLAKALWFLLPIVGFLGASLALFKPF